MSCIGRNEFGGRQIRAPGNLERNAFFPIRRSGCRLRVFGRISRVSRVQTRSIKYWESNPVLIELAGCIQNLLRSEAGDLAHLKIALIPDEDIGGIAAINLVRIDSSPEISQQLSEPIQSGELVLNLRAEADPELLHATLNRAILVLVDKHPDLFARLEHCEHFRPGKRRSAEPVADLV